MDRRFVALRSLRWWWVFALAGLSFMGFGVSSFNLFRLLKANLSLFADYGLMVAGEGALLQLAQLVGLGYLSLLFWLGFKACENRLVRGRGG